MQPATKYLLLPDPSLTMKERKLSWEEYGDPKNPRIICCMHGLSRNSRDFKKVALRLSSGYRVICPDMAGRGASSWLSNKQDYNYAVYVHDIMTLLSHLRITALHWLGTSMGGITGMMVASQNPQLVQSLILNDVGSNVNAKGLQRIMGYIGNAGVFEDKSQAMQHLKAAMASFGIKSQEEWESMFDASFDTTKKGEYRLKYDPAIGTALRAAFPQETEIQDIDLSLFWNAVTCPVLLLRGEESDILSHDTALHMQKGKTNVTVKEFAGVGHAPALLDEIQIRTVTDWLDRTARYADKLEE